MTEYRFMLCNAESAYHLRSCSYVVKQAGSFSNMVVGTSELSLVNMDALSLFAIPKSAFQKESPGMPAPKSAKVSAGASTASTRVAMLAKKERELAGVATELAASGVELIRVEVKLDAVGRGLAITETRLAEVERRLAAMEKAA
ncbi:unnamed protein product [Phytophthora fragariaefolia]|uniref:Unnamed protein product n=1 Tax=Phytophthora fragariaefolia TaxID=1490495 RepID=A0A9W6Y249_9STRA|nr:unnamed protein product [Phytophthora fragariaefolia]